MGDVAKTRPHKKRLRGRTRRTIVSLYAGADGLGQLSSDTDDDETSRYSLFVRSIKTVAALQMPHRRAGREQTYENLFILEKKIKQKKIRPYTFNFHSTRRTTTTRVDLRETRTHACPHVRSLEVIINFVR